MGNDASRKAKAQCAGCLKEIHPQSGKYRKCSFLNCMVVYCGDCKKDYMFKNGGNWYCPTHNAQLSETSGKATKARQPPSARAAAVKRDQPPTPAMTPGTQAVYRGNEFGSSKRMDNSQTPTGLQGDFQGYFGYQPPQHQQIPMPFPAPMGVPGQQQNSYGAPFVPLGNGDMAVVKVEEDSTDELKARKKRSNAAKKAAELLEKAKESASPKTAAAAADAARSAAMLYSQSMSQSLGTTAGTGSINSIELLNKMLESKGDAGLMIHGDLDTNQDGNSIRPRYWTPEEDEKLRKAVEQYGAKHWKTIATFVPGRTHVQCLQRWNKVLKPGLRKGAWTDIEDSTLQNLVDKMQPDVNWGEVADHIPGRSAKQCRERWSFNLDPSINKGDWTEEEDETLLRLQKEVGNKWSQIAVKLPGRTENAIKTRFKSILRAKKREWRPAEDALLLKYHEELGNKWEEIASKLPNRTKNAVKTRFKFLTEENPVKAPKKPTSKQEADKKRATYVRTGASQSSKAALMSEEARARARVAAAAAVAAADAVAAQAKPVVAQIKPNPDSTPYHPQPGQISGQPMPGQMHPYPIPVGMPAGQQQPEIVMGMRPTQPMYGGENGQGLTPSFQPYGGMGTPLGAQQGSMSSLNSLKMNSLSRSNKDSHMHMDEMLTDLANMEFNGQYNPPSADGQQGVYMSDGVAYDVHGRPIAMHVHPDQQMRSADGGLAGNTFDSAFDDLNLEFDESNMGWS